MRKNWGRTSQYFLGKGAFWKLLQVQKKFNKELQDNIEFIFTAEIWKCSVVHVERNLTCFQGRVGVSTLVRFILYAHWRNFSNSLWVFVTRIKLWWMFIGRHCSLSSLEFFEVFRWFVTHFFVSERISFGLSLWKKVVLKSR